MMSYEASKRWENPTIPPSITDDIET